LRFHARGERGRWDISSMLWGCNPHTPPGGASPPGTPLSVVTFRGPRWALLRRPAVVTFGAHCWGVASPPSGGHLRCSLLGRCFAAQRWSPSVLTVGALFRSPPVVTFGAHGWGVASPPSGGHLRCSLLGRCFARLRGSPWVAGCSGVASSLAPL
jgi:hypothetical protein